MTKKVKTTKKSKPIENGRNGKGQFGKENQCAVGRHNVKSVQIARDLKKTLLSAVTEKDMKAVVKKLIEQAKNGEIAAIKELFDRCLGKPLQTHEVDIEVRTYTPEQCDIIRQMLAERCDNAGS